MEQLSSESAFSAVEFAENPEPRVPCVLIVDTSTSMQGPRIDELNKGLAFYKDELLGWASESPGRIRDGAEF
jgi:hypothetical protein